MWSGPGKSEAYAELPIPMSFSTRRMSAEWRDCVAIEPQKPSVLAAQFELSVRIMRFGPGSPMAFGVD
jgi:hypothetical protein